MVINNKKQAISIFRGQLASDVRGRERKAKWDEWLEELARHNTITRLQADSWKRVDPWGRTRHEGPTFPQPHAIEDKLAVSNGH